MIKLENVTKTYKGDIPALRNADVDIAKGEFVFLVGIPTMFAASAYAFLELWLDQGLGEEAWGDVAIAFVAAMVTGFVVVKWLLGYIKGHRFTGFAVYRIALGIGLLLLMPSGG